MTGLKQIRIGYLSTLYHTSHILKARSDIEKLGVTVRWQLFGTGPAMIQAFSAGEVDMGYIGLPPAMIGISRGLQLACIAGGHMEGTVLVGPKHLPAAEGMEDIAATLNRFRGKKIGAPARGSIHDSIMRHYLEKYDIQAEIVNYPWADLMPQAILDGEIAAAAGTPALAAVAELWYGCTIIIAPRLLWPCNPSYGIAVRTSLIAESGFLRGFLEMHERACNLLREEPARAAQITAEEIKVVAADFLERVLAISPHYCAALPERYRRSAMAFVPVLQQQGAIKGQLSEDQVFDVALIAQVHGQADHY